MKKRRYASIEDGFNSELVRDAYFAGKYEIPIMATQADIVIPSGMIPFSLRRQTKDHSEFVAFYEYDPNFADIIREPVKYVEELRSFPGLLTPDCSLYRDMPLVAQIANTYRNRALGYFFQQQGLTVIPNIRWGDERSFAAADGENFAFAGVPKGDIVAIGTYGCIKGYENSHYFKLGLQAMLAELEPRVVLVYGRMPARIFADFTLLTKFVPYADWISQRHACSA